jgi:hypothetical protein
MTNYITEEKAEEMVLRFISKHIFVASVFICQVHTHIMHIKSVRYTQQRCYDFPKNHICTPSGFEPGSSVPEVPPAPRRQGGAT